MQTFKQYLGPKATSTMDKTEIKRQKLNLSRLSKEYHKMSKDEGGSGTAKAHGVMFDNAKNYIHNEDVVKEDGAVGGMSVAAVAGSGDSRLPSSQREPGVGKTHNPTLGKLKRRSLPQV